MKYPQLTLVALVLVSGWTVARLARRWREERLDHRLTLFVDYSEIRDLASRQALSDEDLLVQLKNAGANAVLIGASTIQDYLWRDMTFSSRAPVEVVLHQLEE